MHCPNCGKPADYEQQFCRVNVPGKKPAGEISGSADTKSLPTHPIPASLPSVTEHTTQLLPTDAVRERQIEDR